MRNNFISKYLLIWVWILFLGINTHVTYATKIDKSYLLLSPDKNLAIDLQWHGSGTLTYTFIAGGVKLINASPLGFCLDSFAVIPTTGWQIMQVAKRKVRSTWEPVWGKRSVVPDCFNELMLELSGGNERINIVVRAYNDGIAFRYEVPVDGGVNANVFSELTAYHFAGDYLAWFYNGENHNLGPERLTETNGIRLPVMTVKIPDGTYRYMALHEACLEKGEPLRLVSEKGSCVFRVLSKPRQIYPGYQSAWRVILCSKVPGGLVDSHLLELLNPDPPASMDFSWVKLGMAVWDWRINGAQWEDFTYSMSYPSWVRMVDFAAEQGFRYLVLDANWYGPEFEYNSDPISGHKAEEVQRLIRYGRQKGIGIWLYLNDVGGQKYPIEKTLEQYGKWGAAGVKYGFMQGTMEEKNNWTRKVTELCAQNHLLVDFHDGPVHPYGQMRTWPNAVTREYCHAQLDGHHVFEPKTFVTTVFVNMVAGPLDMNNGMFDLRQGKTTRVDNNQEVPATVVAEAARTLITYSGITILPDIPEYYHKYPELLRFLSAQKMPWRESRTLDGEIGKYIVLMRQASDGGYLVGAATNEEKRILHIPFSFLSKGIYEAEIVEDGEDAHYLTNREIMKVTRRMLSRKDIVEVKLAPGGGTCIRLTPVKL